MKRAQLTVLAAVMALPGLARASGFAAARFGGEHGTVALRHATWTHAQAATDEPEPPGAQGASFGKATLFNVFGGPALGATTRLGPLALGTALTVPFGGRASWDKNERV